MSDSPASPQSCPKCGADLPTEATDGLCPRCILSQAMQGHEPKTPTGRWEPPTPEELQKLLPQYEITALLGRGGMGAVYKARQISLDRPVAIKILSTDLEATDTSFAERFKNEARSMARLNHPGIVAVHDFGQTTSGLLYIVMEYIEGTDVSRMIAQQKRLHTEHAMAITAHVCDALAYAHERGIIHRDIKPANIMVSYDGVVKVADFGLAKMNSSAGESSGLTQSGMAMGTLHFMAPEALMLGTAVDHRADIYAVGVMLYQMLTGKLPQGIFELPSLQVSGLDPRYDGIIAKAMREDRAIRYQKVTEMRFDLDHILTQPVVKVEPGATEPPAALPAEARPHRPAGQPYRPPQPRTAPPPARKSGIGGIMMGFTLVLAMLGGGYYWLRPQPTGPATSATTTEHPLPANNTSTPALTPAAATKEHPFANTLGMQFVPVPGTSLLFCIHETRQQDYAAFAAAKPGLRDDWKKAQHQGVPCGQEPTHPVCAVSFEEARQFCTWLSQKEGLTYRLPTDIEWSIAVGISKELRTPGTTPSMRFKPRSREFPWGDTYPPTTADQAGNYGDQSYIKKFPGPVANLPGYLDGYPTTAPVMSFKPNLLGLYDMGGNVYEWVDDWWDTTQKERVMRGASWNGNDAFPDHLASSGRRSYSPDNHLNITGFRLVLDTTPRPASPSTSKASLPAIPAPTTKPQLPTPPASPQPPPLTGVDLQLSQLQQSFQAATEREAGAVFKAAVTKLNAGYTRVLETAITTATQSARLNEVVQLKDEQTALTQLPAPSFPPPDDAKTTAALKTLRTTYRSALATYTADYARALIPLYEKYDQTLTTLQAEQTRNGKIPEALRIQSKLEIMRQWRSTILAKAATQPGFISQQALAAASATVAASKDNPFINTLGMQFVPVPGTDILMCIHETRKKDFASYAAANAGVGDWWTKVELDGKPVSTSDDHPVAAVSWEDAQAFCTWLSKKEGQTYRLPTEVEWNFAVVNDLPDRTKVSPDVLQRMIQNQYPWGAGFPPPEDAGKYSTTGSQFPTTAPVMSFKPNALGIYDLGGNISEWCQDWYDSKQMGRLNRGAAFSAPGNILGSGQRFNYSPTSRQPWTGFRCVLQKSGATTNTATVATVVSATKDKPFTNTLNMQFVPVPITGGTTDGRRVLFSIWLTRVQDYEPFVRETSHEWIKPDFQQGPTHPAVFVSWDGAQAFCRWLTQRERQAGRIPADQVYRLPSDHEWSCAVGIGKREDAAKPPAEKSEKLDDVFPWGKTWPPKDHTGNYASEELSDLLQTAAKKPTNLRDIIPGYRDGHATTAPVGTYPANTYGLFDMGGNAWQWCEDWYDSSQKARVRRGPCWNIGSRNFLLSSHRDESAPSDRFSAFGFRCVLASQPSTKAAP